MSSVHLCYKTTFVAISGNLTSYVRHNLTMRSTLRSMKRSARQAHFDVQNVRNASRTVFKLHLLHCCVTSDVDVTYVRALLVDGGYLTFTGV